MRRGGLRQAAELDDGADECVELHGLAGFDVLQHRRLVGADFLRARDTLVDPNAKPNAELVRDRLCFNPISALTHATLVDLLQFPLTRELSIAMMREAETIAKTLGITFRVGIDKRVAGAEKVGAHKTSMLQDVEAGKAIELDALVGAVVELGRLTNTPTPHIDAVYACASLLAKTLADQQGRLRIERTTT